MTTLYWCLFIVPMCLASIHEIRQYRRRPRKSVDWPKVYEMEMQVWGQTFEHMGAPPSRIDDDGYFHTRRSFPMENIETLAAAQRTINERRRKAGLPRERPVKGIPETPRYNPFDNPSQPFESRAVRRLHDMRAMREEMPCLCDDDRCFNLFGTLVNCPKHDPTPIETKR